MADRDTRKRRPTTAAQIAAASLDERDEELLDALVTAPAARRGGSR